MICGPLDFPSIVDAAAARAWVDYEDGYLIMKRSLYFRFAKLVGLKTALVGRMLFVPVRFAIRTVT